MKHEREGALWKAHCFDHRVRFSSGCYGSSFYETPNLDRVAAEGMRFTDAYSASPVCTPTRASIMTGKNPARLGITAGALQDRYLELEEITIAEALKPAGYVSAAFGKWHLNPSKAFRLLGPVKKGTKANGSKIPQGEE